MFSDERKMQRISTLRYIVASRWFLHAGIVILGMIQKVIGVADFDLGVFALIFVTYSYNFGYYLYLHRDPARISSRGLYIISILQVVVDQLVYTFVLYNTGGIESLSFLFYFLSIFIAIILFRELEIITLTLFTVVLYISIIYIEYIGLVPHHPRYAFDPGFYQNIGITVHNSATVVLILIFTAFFAAFISNLIRSREGAITAERDKVATIIDNLVDGVIMLDTSGFVRLINPYAQHLLHLEHKQDIRGKLDVEEFPNSIHDLVKLINSTVEEPTYRNEEVTIREEEEHIILQTTALQLTSNNGRQIGVLIILRNITREKDLDQIKSDFISVAAHQLRTPLATLKWLFKMLLDGDGGQLSAKQLDLLGKGFERNNEVIEIVNNLLDVSEIEDGRFPYKFLQCSVKDIVNQVIKDTQVNAERKQITVKNDFAGNIPQIKCDRQKMKMAIQNLVDNAIKYSHSNSKIKISLHQEDDEAVLSVQDEGIGMSDESQEKVFTKFFRGHEATIQDPTGSGLGLYIVRNIVEKHGGKVFFESQLNSGTTFTVRLPL